MGTDWDVVIIGGGAAGIAATRRLATSGLSTLLLEASQRIGGRAHTVNMAGHALDLGCGWLHSADRNLWIGIAEAGPSSIATWASHRRIRMQRTRPMPRGMDA
jgi:monoamine oxidase